MENNSEQVMERAQAYHDTYKQSHEDYIQNTVMYFKTRLGTAILRAAVHYDENKETYQNDALNDAMTNHYDIKYGGVEQSVIFNPFLVS